MAESVRIIKKYQNRKLYDTQDSCYVTLDGIAKMIRQGEEIVVIDNNTKDDVTALIFTQVLYEQEKTNQSVLPVTILKNIIKAGSNNLFEFMQKFILTSLTAPTRAQEEIQLHIDRLVKKGDLNATEGAALTAQMRQIIAQTQESLDQKIQQRVNENISNAATNPAMGAQLQDLATRLQQLEGRPS